MSNDEIKIINLIYNIFEIESIKINFFLIIINKLLYNLKK